MFKCITIVHLSQWVCFYLFIFFLPQVCVCGSRDSPPPMNAATQVLCRLVFFTVSSSRVTSSFLHSSSLFVSLNLPSFSCFPCPPHYIPHLYILLFPFVSRCTSSSSSSSFYSSFVSPLLKFLIDSSFFCFSFISSTILSPFSSPSLPLPSYGSYLYVFQPLAVNFCLVLCMPPLLLLLLIPVFLLLRFFIV